MPGDALQVRHQQPSLAVERQGRIGVGRGRQSVRVPDKTRTAERPEIELCLAAKPQVTVEVAQHRLPFARRDAFLEPYDRALAAFDAAQSVAASVPDRSL